MTSAQTPATPDLMALLCLMGGAVGGAEAAHFLTQLLTIGSLVPSFGMALRAWISAEEQAGASPDGAGVWFPEEAACEGDEDAVSLGWTRRSGTLLLWRHVTRIGTVMWIPIECPWLQRVEPLIQAEAAWSLLWLLSAGFFAKFSLDGVAAGTNCA